MSCREVRRATVELMQLRVRMEIPLTWGAPVLGGGGLISPPSTPPLGAPPTLRPRAEKNFMCISDNEIKTLFLPHCKRPLVKYSVWPIVANGRQTGLGAPS